MYFAFIDDDYFYYLLLLLVKIQIVLILTCQFDNYLINVVDCEIHLTYIQPYNARF